MNRNRTPFTTEYYNSTGAGNSVPEQPAVKIRTYVRDATDDIMFGMLAVAERGPFGLVT
jgi:hypothetical protein